MTLKDVLDSLINDGAILGCALVLLWVGLLLRTIGFWLKRISSTFERTLKKDVPTCSKCSTEILKDTKYCHHCGESVRIQCSSCQTLAPKESKYCPMCKNRLWLGSQN